MRDRALQKWITAFAISLVIALANLSPWALGADRIKLALPGNSMGYLPLHVAVHKGFFKDEGIDIEVPRLVRAIYRGLRFAKENPAETINVIERQWKVEPDVAKESYEAIVKALNDDGIIGEKQLKVHFDLIRKTEKNIGEIPVEKVVDFRLLKEVLREARGG